LAFRFARPAHDTGTKTIFGSTGDYDGDQLVDLILQQPATPRFLARKLFVYFVHEEPNAATIDALSGVLRRNNYELAPFLKTLFLSREFYSSRAMGAQVKSPAQLVVGTLRTLPSLSPPLGKGGKGGYEPAPLLQALRVMGQDLMEPPNVKGWEEGRAWINTNTLFARDNFAAAVVARTAGAGPAARAGTPRPAARGSLGPLARELDLVTPLKERRLDTPATIVDHYAKVLLPMPLAEAQRAELVSFLGTLPPMSEWADRQREINAKLGGLLALIMSLPEYQLT
jgi:uncharacterized protein (DUF1800 family)